MFIVTTKDDCYEETLIFKGSKKDAETIFKTLAKYHEYDNTIVSIQKEETPEFKSLDDFLQVYEYKYTLDQLS